MKDSKYKIFNCSCKEGFHKIDISIPIWAYVADTIIKLGEMIKVTNTIEGKTYFVQRIYIAIHGLKEKDLYSLNFKEASS